MGGIACREYSVDVEKGIRVDDYVAALERWRSSTCAMDLEIEFVGATSQFSVGLMTRGGEQYGHVG
ncbi:hypothetical protein PanWU01x14_060890 [Parasponia andersonii]|uniref:Uncharacterized protein n=1 Tax=Parasponia andersonii TaxID=3476 RepID=A0A2P5DI02_PARAD|nr:hypothetical protein PanWU01x14_060890 [Parasponia andersonii]